MQLSLKHSQTHWIKIPEGDAEFNIDYPTIEQQDILDQLLYENSFLAGIDQADDIEKELQKTMDNLGADKKARMIVLNNKFYRLFLKFVIKDWKGIKDDEGNDVKCEVRNNELKDELWSGLCKNLSLNDLVIHYQRFAKELEFNQLDKKK